MKLILHTASRFKNILKKYAPVCITIVILLAQVISCSDTTQEEAGPDTPFINITPPLLPTYDPALTEAILKAYRDSCWDCKWYFCPPLDSVWQKQIYKNSLDRSSLKYFLFTKMLWT